MQMEIRADGVYLEGYVNVPMRESKPVIVKDKTGNYVKMIEVIEPRVFERALEKTSNVPMTLDHDKNRVLAQTNDGTLELREDQIGLHAKAIINDPEIIEGAKNGLLKGWSFGMNQIKSSVTERADNLPLRKITDLFLDHVTLVMKKNPCYSATSVELRADNEEPIELETRAIDDELTITELISTNVVETPKENINLAKFKNRINKLKVGK